MCANGAQTHLSYYHIIKGVFHLKTLKSISGAKIWFLALSAFVGLSSLNSAMALFIRPDGAILGIGEFLPALEHLPFGAALFKNYIFAAVILLLACAVPRNALRGFGWCSFAGSPPQSFAEQSFGRSLPMFICQIFCLWRRQFYR